MLNILAVYLNLLHLYVFSLNRTTNYNVMPNMVLHIRSNNKCLDNNVEIKVEFALKFRGINTKLEIALCEIGIDKSNIKNPTEIYRATYLPSFMSTDKRLKDNNINYIHILETIEESSNNSEKINESLDKQIDYDNDLEITDIDRNEISLNTYNILKKYQLDLKPIESVSFNIPMNLLKENMHYIWKIYFQQGEQKLLKYNLIWIYVDKYFVPENIYKILNDEKNNPWIVKVHFLEIVLLYNIIFLYMTFSKNLKKI